MCLLIYNISHNGLIQAEILEYQKCPFSPPYTPSPRSDYQFRLHGFSHLCYTDDVKLYLSFPPVGSTGSLRISTCVSDISKWMIELHLQFSLSDTELLVIPAVLLFSTALIYPYNRFMLRPLVCIISTCFWEIIFFSHFSI